MNLQLSLVALTPRELLRQVSWQYDHLSIDVSPYICRCMQRVDICSDQVRVFWNRIHHLSWWLVRNKIIFWEFHEWFLVPIDDRAVLLCLSQLSCNWLQPSVVNFRWVFYVYNIWKVDSWSNHYQDEPQRMQNRVLLIAFDTRIPSCSAKQWLQGNLILHLFQIRLSP